MNTHSQPEEPTISQLLVPVHVWLTTLGIGAFAALDVVLAAVARSGDVRAVRTTFGIVPLVGRVFRPLTLLGILIGFATAAGRGYSLLDGWLIAAYLLLLGGVALAIGLTVPRRMRVLAAAQQSSDEAPSPDLQRALARVRQPLGAYVLAVLMGSMIYVMFAKPFGAG